MDRYDADGATPKPQNPAGGVSCRWGVTRRTRMVAKRAANPEP